MEQIAETKQRIIQFLKTLSVCKNSSNGLQWTIRCPYCGDSRTANHGHFSIKINTNDESPIMYHCLKCNEGGLLTSQVLEDLGIGSTDPLLRELRATNMLVNKGAYFKDRIKDYKVEVPIDNFMTKRKIQYIENRIGVTLTPTECASYKIITSLSSFLMSNNIEINTKTPTHDRIDSRMVYELDSHYVGFLSSNNNKIIFRDITPNNSGKFGRYFKLVIDSLNESPNTFYSLVSRFELLYTEPINIHIAEGTFDILSVYKNLEYSTSQNSLFFAAGGYNYTTILKYLIYKGVTTNITLHLYSDADKTDKNHLWEMRTPLCKVWLDNVIIHRNGYSGEKDFGVPKDRIEDISYPLKIK